MLKSPLLQNVSGFINGQWYDAGDAESFAVINPADGSTLADVPKLGSAETRQAIECADAWMRSGISIADRGLLLKAIGDQITANRDELGRIITHEHGKPLKEAVTEADYAASFFQFYADHVDYLDPKLLTLQPRGHAWRVFARPAGVAGLITPWNFPIAMLAKKMSAAIAAGCGCVVKPSSKTPLATVALFALLQQLGIPAGMLNLVMGTAAEISKTLCEHPAVRVISFTGSTEVGRKLMQDSAAQLKRLSLELGGNAPFIVFEDADLNLAAEHLVQNKFRASGQTCVCANRIYVQASVVDKFVEILERQVRALKVSNGMEPGCDIGPLIDKHAYLKVKGHVDDAISKGARVIVGASDPDEPKNEYGCFFPPTILTQVKSEMRCVREETFGPIVPIISFESEEEAVQAANATEYGLASYLFTADRQRGNRVSEQLKFGHVGLNSGTGPAAAAPFGGFKQSGFGREGGIEGLHDFVEYQTVAEPLS